MKSGIDVSLIYFNNWRLSQLNIPWDDCDQSKQIKNKKITRFYFLTCMIFIFIFVNTFSQYYPDKIPKSYLYYLTKVFIVDKILCRVTRYVCVRPAPNMGEFPHRKVGQVFYAFSLKMHNRALTFERNDEDEMMKDFLEEGSWSPPIIKVFYFLLSFREQGIRKSALVWASKFQSTWLLFFFRV